MSICEGCAKVVIRACFKAILGLCVVVIAVYMATTFGCDRKPQNSLYWDVDAPIAHPFCDQIATTFRQVVKVVIEENMTKKIPANIYC